MILKTKDYTIFKFRNDNRFKIDKCHLQKIKQSIESHNMLDLRPILVNRDMEVIDGQHRLLAAKELELEVYYSIDKNIKPQDIVKMNMTKPWVINDYLNFYAENAYPEYIKLREFMKKNSLEIHVACGIAVGKSKLIFDDFKNGKFKFINDYADEQIEICKETIAYIKKINGYSKYTDSGRFWKALLKLARHENFNPEKWFSNLSKMISYFLPLGLWSYSLLLTNVMIGPKLIGFVDRITSMGNTLYLIVLALGTVGSIAWAYVFYRWVEEPLTHLGTKASLQLK